MQAQLSLPSLSAGMPARSLSRTDFVKSAIDIEVQDTLVRDVDERRASSVMERQYPAAQSYYNTMLELKEVYEREERERELARQKEEGRKLQDAFVHLDHDLNTEWDERMHQFELKCEEMWKHLAERHAVAKEELNKSCEPLRRLKPKFSPELLAMMRSESVLAKQHRYNESNEVKRRVEIRKAVELEDFNQSIATRIRLRYERLEAAQEEERKETHARIHGMRTTIRRKRDLAMKRQRQRLTNNSHDMTHAHRLEFSDIQARVPKLAVKPRRSFMHTSSTFKGTHICRELAPTHTPGSWGGVLAVVDMQASQSMAEQMNLTRSVEFTGREY
jgi:hypothetical protein